MELSDILVNCSGRNFVNDRSVNDQIMNLEDILRLCEDLYCENDVLNEKIEDMERDIEDNYIPRKEDYGMSQEDFYG